MSALTATTSSFLRALLGGRGEGRGGLGFVLGIIFSFAFSISVILCTVGLMDGFEHTLKRSLKLASGDLVLHSKRGFFTVSPSMEELFREQAVFAAPLVQTEGFVVQENFSKGVVVKGISPESLRQVFGLDVLPLAEGEMAIGVELAQVSGLKKGDRLALALARGQRRWSSLPALYGFRIKQVIDHGLYDKNMRLVYVNLPHLQTLLNLGQRVNVIALNKFAVSDVELVPKVESLAAQLSSHLDPMMVIRPFWHEFAPLLKAVEVEKLAMTLILQLIVIIAIFNVVAFVSFLGQQKAREIFLLAALGVSRKHVMQGWTVLLTAIWALSCLLAIGFAHAFEWAMLNFSFLELPGEVYGLGRIQVRISLGSYLMAFALALLWLLAISWWGLRGLRQKTLLSHLRLQFSQ